MNASPQHKNKLNNKTIIHVDNVSFSYHREKVLQDIDLRIQQGDFLAIIGPNGGGKTTLMKLLLGLLAPQRGIIKVFGDPPGHHADKIGYVPQHSNIPSGFPALVQDVVLMGLSHGRRHGPWYRKDEYNRAKEAMNHLEILPLARTPYAEISGGQRQRVLIARALITQPELLIMDEPLANIDPYGRQCLVEILSHLGRNITIIMVSHDLGITVNAINGIIAINRFAIQEAGNQPTKSMLELMYGIHGIQCPVNKQIQEFSS